MSRPSRPSKEQPAGRITPDLLADLLRAVAAKAPARVAAADVRVAGPGLTPWRVVGVTTDRKERNVYLEIEAMDAPKQPKAGDPGRLP